MMTKQTYGDLYTSDPLKQEQNCIKPCSEFENIQKRYIQGENSIQSQEGLSTGDNQSCPSRLKDRAFEQQTESLQFLQEHILVLSQLFSQSQSLFDESSIINRKQTNSTQFSIFKPITLQRYLTVLFERLSTVKPDLVKLFKSHVQSCKYFRRFLQHLFYSYPACVVHYIFKYVFFIWELYYPNFNQRLTIDKIVCQSKKIYRQICKTELRSILHSYQQNLQNIQRLKNLIKILTITFILIMQRCSFNPYFTQSNVKKDQQSQQDCEISKAASTHKIVKRESSRQEQ